MKLTWHDGGALRELFADTVAFKLFNWDPSEEYIWHCDPVYIHVLSGKINSWNSVCFCFAWCTSYSSLFYWKRKCVSCDPQNWFHGTLLAESDREFGNYDLIEERGEKWFERKKVPCVAVERRADPSGWDSGRASWRRWLLSWALSDGVKPVIWTGWVGRSDYICNSVCIIILLLFLSYP